MLLAGAETVNFVHDGREQIAGGKGAMAAQRCSEALQSCDVLLVIGTSGVVYPAAGFASVAKQAGATVVEINLDDTPQSNLVDLALRGRAKDLVPQLL